MLRIHELKLKIEIDQEDLLPHLCKYLKVKPTEVIDYKIIKRSLDARKKSQFFFSYTIDLHLKNEKLIILNSSKVSLIVTEDYHLPSIPKNKPKHRPIIMGFGPGGMFAALVLAEMGLKPIVFERGAPVEERVKDVSRFWEERILNPESNIQFGEGGAGTFSDGKLTTRVKDLRSHYILKTFVEMGAHEEIMYVHNPHIGTDVLRGVLTRIRQKIIALGGEIHFHSKVTQLLLKDSHIIGVIVNEKQYETNEVIGAIGHSARDTFSMLYDQGIQLSQKAFAVGFRIEHPQLLINHAQYGEHYVNYPKLNAAEYKLTYHTKENRSVYTFCMCPGGMVVPSSSEVQTVVVNGMSEFARNRENANSAIVCTVDEKDFKSTHVLAGMYFQQKCERAAFVLGGNNYDAPIQLVKDFIENIPSTALGTVQPSYPIGCKLTNLNDLFPPEITEAIKEAIQGLNSRLPEFSMDEAILTAVETRTSSPIRINRDEDTLESLTVKGFYPCGEGAGYAGGIMSAAIDGMKIAEKIIQNYQL